MINNILPKLLQAARSDPQLKQTLLKTREDPDPMAAFCEAATACGYPITIGDLICLGEEYSCNQLKSTNGGGVNPYEYFDDEYEMFFAALES